MQAQKAEGTRDLIGAEMRAWQKMQQIAAGVFEPFGFKPIETPAIEQVDVFVHGIGQSTDVVRKEMFRVFSGANLERVFTEGTDTKLKQKGRLRQFHQVGIEWLGAPDPAADAECIIMLMEFYKRLGFDLSKLRLLINSMGDAQCRPAYREQVKQFILDHVDEMCDECRERAELNPLRAFDCKNDHCREIMADAPLMGDNLCDECREHYEQVKRYLDAAGSRVASPRQASALPSVLSAPCWPCRPLAATWVPRRPRVSTSPTPARSCVRTSLPLRSSFVPQAS